MVKSIKKSAWAILSFALKSRKPHSRDIGNKPQKSESVEFKNQANYNHDW